jgi:hypothetical protein
VPERNRLGKAGRSERPSNDADSCFTSGPVHARRPRSPEPVQRKPRHPTRASRNPRREAPERASDWNRRVPFGGTRAGSSGAGPLAHWVSARREAGPGTRRPVSSTRTESHNSMHRNTASAFTRCRSVTARVLQRYRCRAMHQHPGPRGSQLPEHRTGFAGPADRCGPRAMVRQCRQYDRHQFSPRVSGQRKRLRTLPPGPSCFCARALPRQNRYARPAWRQDPEPHGRVPEREGAREGGCQ